MAEEIKKGAIAIIVGAVLFHLLFKFILIPGYIPSESMLPTLKVGDLGFANCLAYIFGDPKRGDIIVIRSDELGEVMIKRLIGLPGETVSFHDGNVYIDDSLLEEAYIAPDVRTEAYVNEFIIPDDCYFLLGDNRECSFDSRFWDEPYVSRDNVIGKFIGPIVNLEKSD